jgi:biopolymer transport protein ExbD
MRRKSRQGTDMPEVNLVPMMDVVMTILTFFLIISMTLRQEQKVVNTSLPSAQSSPSPSPAKEPPKPLIVQLNRQGVISVEKQPVSEAELPRTIQTYLAANPEGSVILDAEPKMPYKQVVAVLGTMQNVGGDRVSLAVE